MDQKPYRTKEDKQPHAAKTYLRDLIGQVITYTERDGSQRPAKVMDVLEDGAFVLEDVSAQAIENSSHS